MITLDTVLLLQQKVESAVAKIEQLTGEVEVMKQERQRREAEYEVFRGDSQTRLGEAEAAKNAAEEQLNQTRQELQIALSRISSLEENQAQIESSIRQSIDKLGGIHGDVQDGGAPQGDGGIQGGELPDSGHHEYAGQNGVQMQVAEQGDMPPNDETQTGGEQGSAAQDSNPAEGVEEGGSQDGQMQDDGTKLGGGNPQENMPQDSGGWHNDGAAGEVQDDGADNVAQDEDDPNQGGFDIF